MVLTDNLLYYFKIDDNAANTTAVDSVGTANGTYSANSSSATTASGKLDRALICETTNNYYISVPDNANFDTQTFSIAFWAKTTSIANMVAVSKWWDNSNRQWDIGFNNKVITFLIGYAGSFKSVTYNLDYTDGAWRHYGFSMNNGTVKIYVNGSEVASNATGYTMLYNSRAMYIGQSSYHGVSNYLEFIGNIDELGFWNKVLTTEFNNLYNGGTGLTYPFLTAPRFQINIGDAWKTVAAVKINIGDAWKDVTAAQINIGDSWKSI